MSPAQIAAAVTGALLGVAGALLDSGVDTADVEAGLADALAQMTSIPAAELAQNASEWAKLHALIGKAQA